MSRNGGAVSAAPLLENWMLIQYKTTKSKREVRDSTGRALIKRGIAKQVYPTQDMEPEEISPRTGKPKRRYKRRDMQPEE